MAEFISLYSGSSGNCSVVRCGGSYLLVDMGKGVRVTTGALREAGLEAADCGGILITHEHSDHVKGLATFLKRHQLPVYGAGATIGGAGKGGHPAGGLSGLRAGPRVRGGGRCGGLRVRAFPTSHDVPCVGLPHRHPRRQDHGHRHRPGRVDPPPSHAALAGCDLVALESNYDPYMLRNGPYPYYLRARIEGPRGHLSNDECSEKLLELVQGGCEKFALCHLSQENNTPAPGAADRLYHVRGGGGGAGPGLHRPDPAPQ